MKTVMINGHTRYTSTNQILQSSTFKKLTVEIIGDAIKRKSSMLEFINLFLKDNDVAEISKKYDIEAIGQLFAVLTTNSIESIDSSSYYDFPKLSAKRNLLVKFVEELFSLWRIQQRFMIKEAKYTSNPKERIYTQMMLVETNEDLRNLVLRVYREILINVSAKRLKVLRQLPCGAQAGIMVDTPKFQETAKIKNGEFLEDMKYVWNILFEPPVIFNTQSNKRRGVTKVVDEPILHKVNLEDKDDWLVFPIHVCKQNIRVVVHKQYLALASGLGNLFELASFDYIQGEKVDGVYIMGMSKEWFEENSTSDDYDDWNGIVYKEENDGPYVALLGRDTSTDYFGYMKKIILTIHNLRVIDEGRLPIHGAMAEIKLLNGKKANVLMMGDSGAGKSETLEALLALKDDVSEVNITIDDMGSLDIIENGKKVVAYGTETGAFVRLDDLPPEYAYGAMDRSIFMNPTQINSRVIVPYSNYDEVIKPTDIDYVFYVNNYEAVNEIGVDEISFFEKAEPAIEVFSKGARMAKGTTSEKGLTESYFSNPFGAIQRRPVHEKIVEKYINTMIETGIRVGEVKSSLGLEGFEKKGPGIAARALLKLIDTDK